MSETPKAWVDTLSPFDIVYCYFPEKGTLDPAPKPRPALVLNVNDETNPQRIEIAYGTSQKTGKKYSGEFELTPKDGDAFKQAGLASESKFDLCRRVWLPYNDRWFKPKPSVPPKSSPKMGTLNLDPSPELKRRFMAAAQAAGLLHGHAASDDEAITE